MVTKNKKDKNNKKECFKTTKNTAQKHVFTSLTDVNDVSNTRKFDRDLRPLMHVDLHWLDMPERVKFKLVSMVHNCLHHMAPRYLTDYCIPISDVASRRHLLSARRHYLVVPRHSLSSYGRRTFAVVGPTVWNSLSDDLRDPTLISH